MVYDARHVGAPGVAHGGAVALAFDDLFGFLLYEVGQLGVTRNLSVDYLEPVKLGSQVQIRATAGQQQGRRIPVSGIMTSKNGKQIATATAVFVVVDVDHFISAAQA